MRGTCPRLAVYLMCTKVKPWHCSFPLLLLNISNAAFSHSWTEGRPSSRGQDPELRLEQWLMPQSLLLQLAQAAPNRSITALATALAWHFFYKYQWREMDTSSMFTISWLMFFWQQFFFLHFFIWYYSLTSFCLQYKKKEGKKRWWAENVCKQNCIVTVRFVKSSTIMGSVSCTNETMKHMNSIEYELSVPQMKAWKNFLQKETQWLK